MNTKLGVVQAFHPSYTGSLSRKVKVQITWGIKPRPYSKNNESKKGLGHGSSGRAST
jgi:hypothetical protein